jgi:hypothetical protein
MELLNRHAAFLDLSGADPERPGAGSGYVPEVARLLDQELRRRPHSYLLAAWVDYLGALARRHIAASAHDYSDLRHLVAEGVLLLGSDVARRFGCPLWLTHQLSGTANARGPAARMHHTDAAEAKNAAENADFAFVAGTPTEERQLCVLACTKHRRRPPRRPAVVRIDGPLSRIVDVSGKYVVNRYARKIVPRDEHHGLCGAAHAAPFRQKGKVTDLMDFETWEG